MNGRSPLSDRESQVLQLASEGHIDESIAACLAISITTVRGYWLRIRSKYGGGSRSELVARYTNEIADTKFSAWASGTEQMILDAERRADDAIALERAGVDHIFHRASAADRLALQKLRDNIDGQRKNDRHDEAEARRDQREPTS